MAQTQTPPTKNAKGEMTKLGMIVNDTLTFCRKNNVSLKAVFTLLLGEEARVGIQHTIEQPEIPFEETKQN